MWYTLAMCVAKVLDLALIVTIVIFVARYWGVHI